MNGAEYTFKNVASGIGFAVAVVFLTYMVSATSTVPSILFWTTKQIVRIIGADAAARILQDRSSTPLPEVVASIRLPPVTLGRWEDAEGIFQAAIRKYRPYLRTDEVVVVAQKAVSLGKAKYPAFFNSPYSEDGFRNAARDIILQSVSNTNISQVTYPDVLTVFFRPIVLLVIGVVPLISGIVAVMWCAHISKTRYSPHKAAGIPIIINTIIFVGFFAQVLYAVYKVLTYPNIFSSLSSTGYAVIVITMALLLLIYIILYNALVCALVFTCDIILRNKHWMLSLVENYFPFTIFRWAGVGNLINNRLYLTFIKDIIDAVVMYAIKLTVGRIIP